MLENLQAPSVYTSQVFFGRRLKKKEEKSSYFGASLDWHGQNLKKKRRS